MINFSELLWKPRSSRGRDTPLAVVRDYADNVETPEIPQVPVVEPRLDPTARLVFFTEPRSPYADQFRRLRMHLRELHGVAKLRSILITSPLPGDGKSTVALNLATALAENGKRSVLLIEADLHHPTLVQRLGISPRPGLAECLEEGHDPLSALQRLQSLQWYLMQAGNPHGNRTELLQSEGTAALLQTLAPRFDWILIDAPPVAPLSDAIALSRKADATLLVARADSTPRAAVEEALTLIGPKHVLGIILNGAQRADRLYSKYYSYGGKQ